MRDYLRLMAPVLKAVKERHDDPKNMAKGDDVFEGWSKTNEEFREVSAEMTDYIPSKQYDRPAILRRIRYELADVILSASMTLVAAESELAELEGANCETRTD